MYLGFVEGDRPKGRLLWWVYASEDTNPGHLGHLVSGGASALTGGTVTWRPVRMQISVEAILEGRQRGVCDNSSLANWC